MKDSTFTKYFIGALLAFGLFGFIIPWCLSDPSDAGVTLGLFLFFIAVYFGGLFIKHQIERKDNHEH